MHKLLIANGPTTIFAVDMNRVHEKARKAMKRNALYGVPEDSELFISSDTVQTLHKLLNVQVNGPLSDHFLDKLFYVQDQL
jgi:hypothetical protein